MDLKQELIDRLGVPENWDKYDYQTQRYSFDDVQEVLEGIFKKLTIPAVVEQNEQLVCDCGNKLTDKEIYFGQCLQCDKNIEEAN